MVDHHVDRPEVYAWQHVQPTGTNRPRAWIDNDVRARCGVLERAGCRRCGAAHLTKVSVAIAVGSHPFPFRTRKLSPPAPMVLGRRLPGRVGRRRISLERAPSGGPFFVFDGAPSSVPLRPFDSGRASSQVGLSHGCPALLWFLAFGSRRWLRPFRSPERPRRGAIGELRRSRRGQAERREARRTTQRAPERFLERACRDGRTGRFGSRPGQRPQGPGRRHAVRSRVVERGSVQRGSIGRAQRIGRSQRIGRGVHRTGVPGTSCRGPGRRHRPQQPSAVERRPIRR